MIKLKKLLAPIDFSKGSFLTLNYAIEIAKSLKAELHVIHVIEPIVFSSDIVLTKYGFDELANELEIVGKRDLAKIAKNLEDLDIVFTIKIIHGKPSDEILEYADKNHIDIICIATHGHGAIENFLIGSTAEKVLRKSKCPVLSVRIKE